MLRLLILVLAISFAIGCSSSDSGTTTSTMPMSSGIEETDVSNSTSGATMVTTLGSSAVAGNFAGRIHSASDRDVFRFDVTAAGTFEIETVTTDTYPTNPAIVPAPSGMGPYTLPVPTLLDPLPDPIVTLVRDNISTVIATDNNGGAGREAFISVFLSTNDEYYIVVDTADGSTGEYVIDYRWTP